MTENMAHLDDEEGDRVADKWAHIPQDKIPKIGMIFDSEEEARVFYNNYARLCGFGTRKYTGHKLNNQIYYRKFCCSCQGLRRSDKRDDTVESPRPEIRTDCGAYMSVNSLVTLNGKFKVVKFVADHKGHDMVSQEQVHMLRSHRKITPLQEFFQHLDRLIDDRRYEEVKADLRTIHSTPKLPFSVRILKHARTVYTHEVFNAFQKQLNIGLDADFEPVPSSQPPPDCNKQGNEKSRIGERTRELARLHMQYIARAAMTEETFEFAKKNIFSMSNEIETRLENISISSGKHKHTADDQLKESSIEVSGSEDQTIHDVQVFHMHVGLK